MSFFEKTLSFLGRCRIYGLSSDDNDTKSIAEEGHSIYDDLESCHQIKNPESISHGHSCDDHGQRRQARIKAKQRKLRSPHIIPVVPVCSNFSDFIKNRIKMNALDNLNPKLHKKSDARKVTLSDFDESVVDEIDAREVFDIIRDINDPEHPLTLEELNVVGEDKIEVDNVNNYIKVSFTPTIPHCSMATLIGLAIRVQLMRSLPSRFKIDVEITPGSHASECAINKQLADKERVAAALENSHLIEVVNQCLTIKGY